MYHKLYQTRDCTNQIHTLWRITSLSFEEALLTSSEDLIYYLHHQETSSEDVLKRHPQRMSSKDLVFRLSLLRTSGYLPQKTSSKDVLKRLLKVFRCSELTFGIILCGDTNFWFWWVAYFLYQISKKETNFWGTQCWTIPTNCIVSPMPCNILVPFFLFKLLRVGIQILSIRLRHKTWLPYPNTNFPIRVPRLGTQILSIHPEAQ